jgi:hypothetical protein
MNKGELMKLLFTEKERNNIDTAIPHEWSVKVRELGINPWNFVWSYNENRIGGEVVHLGDEYLKKMQNDGHLPHETLEYLLKKIDKLRVQKEKGEDIGKSLDDLFRIAEYIRDEQAELEEPGN